MFPYIQGRVVVKTNHIFERKIVYHLCKNIKCKILKVKTKSFKNTEMRSSYCSGQVASEQNRNLPNISKSIRVYFSLLPLPRFFEKKPLEDF